MSILKFTKFRKRYLRGKLLTRRSSSREKLIPWVHDDTFDDPLLSIPIGAFSYKGTAEWGLHFQEANGDCQSPININSRETVYKESLNQPPLEVNYALCRDCDLINTGTGIQIIFKYKSDVGMTGLRDTSLDPVPKSVLSGGPLPRNSKFELAACAFHWGQKDDRGSEHTVNFKAYPMELHLIHWNSSTYNTLEEAMGKPHGIAIIALFIQVGREHTGLRTFTDYLEAVQYKGRTLGVTTPFHPSCLLPDPQLRDFWTYQGSLTTPPCYERVTWILFRYPLTISISQMEEFRRLKNHVKGDFSFRGEEGLLVDNFRPTQPLNDRTIEASFQ
ncbi:carbonic anhydrase-related protein-like isoform X1 [Lytechinus pictus]|uniref:carbonic anhydrase-related protein-like isoform X1 n=1 Tax=Lytechinus pictus TaxID=7653 RepID=UPI0030B9D44D